MPPYTCPLIDHIQAQFEGRNVSFPPVLWNGIVLDEAQERIAELEAEVVRLRRSV